MDCIDHENCYDGDHSARCVGRVMDRMFDTPLDPLAVPQVLWPQPAPQREVHVYDLGTPVEQWCVFCEEDLPHTAFVGRDGPGWVTCDECYSTVEQAPDARPLRQTHRTLMLDESAIRLPCLATTSAPPAVATPAGRSKGCSVVVEQPSYGTATTVRGQPWGTCPWV